MSDVAGTATATKPKAEADPSKWSPNVQRFREAYERALNEARVSEEHTATAGWRALYATRATEFKAERRRIGAALKDLGRKMEDVGLEEEEEKWMGELKKGSLALREAMAAFDRQTVEPVRQPVYDCDRVISDAVSLAEREERDNPLLNAGLSKAVREATQSVPRPRWDGRAGVVTIGYGGEAE